MRRRVIQLYIKKQKNNEVIFCLAWNISLLITKKFLFWIFRRWKIWYFQPKSWWKYDIYWLRKISCFNPIGNGKYGLFLSQKVDGKMLFTDYWKGLVLNFSVMGNTVFFESRRWWKDDIYRLLTSSCFELFGDGKHSLFCSQNVDGRMIFTWSF